MKKSHAGIGGWAGVLLPKPTATQNTILRLRVTPIIRGATHCATRCLQRIASVRAQSDKLLYTFSSGTKHHPLGRTLYRSAALTHERRLSSLYTPYEITRFRAELPRASASLRGPYVRLTSGQLLRTLPRKIRAWGLPRSFRVRLDVGVGRRGTQLPQELPRATCFRETFREPPHAQHRSMFRKPFPELFLTFKSSWDNRRKNRGSS